MALNGVHINYYMVGECVGFFIHELWRITNKQASLRASEFDSPQLVNKNCTRELTMKYCHFAFLVGVVHVIEGTAVKLQPTLNFTSLLTASFLTGVEAA